MVRFAFVLALAALISAADGTAQPKVRPVARPFAEATLLSAPAELTRMPPSFHAPHYDVRKYFLCKNFLKPLGYLDTISGYVSGFADSPKVPDAAVAGYPEPALIERHGRSEGYIGSATGTPLKDGHDYDCVAAAAQLNYKGKPEFPPMKITFMGFGFEPVTATATLVESDSEPLRLLSYLDQGKPNPTVAPGTNIAAPDEVVGTARVKLFLSNISINGTPLDVASSCRTDGLVSTPANGIERGALVMAGGDFPDDPEPSLQLITAGGALAGLVTIPPFTGCVTPSGENLDALISAGISGPRNYIQADVDGACVSNSPFQACTKAGLPTQNPNITVTGGGSFSATSGLAIIQDSSPSLTITCTTSTLSGDFPDASGPPRGALASLQWSRIGGCTDGSGNSYRITSDSTAYFSGTFMFPPGTTQSAVKGMSFDITGPGGCSAKLDGFDIAQYQDKSATLTVDPFLGQFESPLLLSQPPGSTPCPGLLASTEQNGYIAYTLTGAYPLGPVHPVITDCPVNRDC